MDERTRKFIADRAEHLRNTALRWLRGQGVSSQVAEELVQESLLKLLDSRFAMDKAVAGAEIATLFVYWRRIYQTKYWDRGRAQENAPTFLTLDGTEISPKRNELEREETRQQIVQGIQEVLARQKEDRQPFLRCWIELMSLTTQKGKKNPVHGTVSDAARKTGVQIATAHRWVKVFAEALREELEDES